MARSPPGFEMIAAAQPDRARAQLLRSLCPGLELAGDVQEHLAGLVEVAMLFSQRDADDENRNGYG